MSSPPTSRVIKMTRDAVHDNLVSIVESMDRIRQESIASLGSSDEQKIDYLRLTGELASCLDAFIKENNLSSHLNTVKGLFDNDALLRNYDPLQQDFWDAREPILKPALQDASAVLLRDDLVSESQSYHVFQGLKYLGINGKDEKDAVYESILPINGLLNSASSSNVNNHLVKKMMSITGAGVKADLSSEGLIKSFADVGALYVDLPKEFFSQMKKAFPRTVMVDEDGKKIARVIFESKEFEHGFNAFDALKEYVSMDLGDAEESLVKKTLNLYGFGKKFVEAMKSKMGVSKEMIQASVLAKPGRGIESRVYEIDEKPEDNGSSKTQDSWFSYWAGINDGREMMSSGDFYSATKQLRQAVESGSKDEKAKAERIIKSLRKDFSGSNWLALSTRLQYNINEQSPLEGRIIQHFKSNNPALVKESSVLEIPIYRGTGIESVLSQENGLHYVQTYFDTDDNAEAITQNLEFISDKKKGSIKVWTADSDSRKTSPDRAAFLDCNFDFDYFRIGGSSGLSNGGRARGVRLSPP